MDTTDQFVLEDEDEYVLVGQCGAAQAAPPAAPEHEEETDAARLAQRTKQVALGKNTPAYRNYIKLVPKHKRKLRGKDAQPQTPDINLKASKRCWAGMLRKWRRDLHAFDPQPGGSTQQNVLHAQQQVQAQQPGLQQAQAQQPPRGQPHGQEGGPQGELARGGGAKQQGHRATPSKRQHGFGSGGASASDAGQGRPAEPQRGSPSKRRRSNEHQVHAAAGGGGSGLTSQKSWADMADDALGVWCK